MMIRVMTGQDFRLPSLHSRSVPIIAFGPRYPMTTTGILDALASQGFLTAFLVALIVALLAGPR